MSRFGQTGTFTYEPTGDFASGTTVVLEHEDMPQYPMKEFRITDKRTARTIGGNAYTYFNYNKVGFEFVWSSLAESKRDELKTMFDANPVVNFNSNGTNFGTFIIDGDYEDDEISFERYDVALTLVEQ